MTMSFRHDFDPTSLREYDIRGVVGRTLHPADAFAIGRCFGTIVARGGGKTVAVGFDGRLSSPALEPELVRGLMACGLEVLRVGLCPTPMLYYTATTMETAGAVMVTGSHNPPDYNGFKMMLGRKPFFGPQIQQIGTHRRRRRRGGGGGGHVARRGRGGGLHHPADQRLGWRRPHPQRGVGQRQRRGRRRAAASGAHAAGQAHGAERGGRRQFPGPPPRPDRAEEPGAADRDREGTGRRSRHRLRRRRGPHRRGGR